MLFRINTSARNFLVPFYHLLHSVTKHKQFCSNYPKIYLQIYIRNFQDLHAKLE